MAVHSDPAKLAAPPGALSARALWAVVLGLVVYGAAGALLLYSADWPAGCEGSELSRGERFVMAYRCSPQLLTGDLVSVLTAIWLWAFPVGVLFFIVFRKLMPAGTVSSDRP